MQDCVNTVSDFGNVREAVCISTRKIMDACRDQDCMEDVPVYLTTASQETLENATTVKARCAELLYTDVSVEQVGYREGYYCVNIQYYYRVIADAVLCAVRPAAIYGLATFTKRVTLFGGEEGVKRFSSDGNSTCGENPVAVVEALDPSVLAARIVDHCHCRKDELRRCALGEGLPEAVAEAFDDELVMGGMSRQLVVTLGQFSLVRLERQTQLLIPSYDYCVPEKVCCDGDCDCQENPCEAFCNTDFPVEAFFPQGRASEETGQNAGRNGCGSCRRNRQRECTACQTAQTALAGAQAALREVCEEEKEDCGCHESGFTTTNLRNGGRNR